MTRSCLVALALTVGCGASSPYVRIEYPLPEGAERGVFVMQNDTDRVVHTTDVALADQRFAPCSTFKIPHALVALETGAVPDEHHVIAWDGAHRDVDAWNHDHDLASAMQDSVVWYFQALARAIGRAREAEWVSRFGYGNANVGDESELDHFWLDGTLTISAHEQVAFLSRLAERSLPVSVRTMDVVASILPSETHGSAVVRAKTGTCVEPSGTHAWWVGWVDDGTTHTSFAALLASSDPGAVDTLRAARADWARSILRDRGVLPRD